MNHPIVDVYSYHPTVGQAFAESPLLLRFVEALGFRPELHHWSGEARLIPRKPSGIVLMDDEVSYDPSKVLPLCERRGHICVHRDRLVCREGLSTPENLLKHMQRFLQDLSKDCTHMLTDDECCQAFHQVLGTEQVASVTAARHGPWLRWPFFAWLLARNV